ncbi:MAG: PAS domain S-box protein [Sphingobacteriales bacterium]|nr:MAG: PAS domain S-box protein [Sphingobacteriales bacterium]
MAIFVGVREQYLSLIMRQFPDTSGDDNNASGTRLFKHIIIFFLPLSIITLVPGVIMSLSEGMPILAAMDLMAFLVVLSVSFGKGFAIAHRKALFVAIIHLIGVALLYYLGSYGPGMLYLLAGTFFTSLIFPGKRGFWSTAFILAVCIAFSIGYHLQLIPAPQGPYYSPAAWITVSVNLVILSATVAVLLPRLFRRMNSADKSFKTVTMATTETIWEWNLDSSRIDYNRGLQEMFGYKAGEMEDTREWWMSRIHPNDRERVEAKLARALHDAPDQSVQLEFSFLCADGSYKHISNRSIAILDENGRAIKIIGAIQDISKIKEYITAIERHNEKLEEISWLYSHSVRSQVATTLGLLQLYNKRDITDPQNSVIIDGIDTSAHKLDTVIKLINELSKVPEELKQYRRNK